MGYGDNNNGVLKCQYVRSAPPHRSPLPSATVRSTDRPTPPTLLPRFLCYRYSDGTCKYSSQDGSPKGNNDNCCPSMATKQCGRRRRRRELSDDEETIMSRQAKIVRDG